VKPPRRRVAIALLLALGAESTGAGAGGPALASQDGGSNLAPLVPVATLEQAGDRPHLPGPPWRVAGLPAQRLPLTHFDIETVGGERVLAVSAAGSYGNLVHPLAGLPAAGHHLSWRWRLEQPLADADLRRREADDAALKVCALFDLPPDRLPFLERQRLALARALSGEHLPGATLCYVWDRRLPPGTVLHNAYSARLRWWVLRGPQDPLQRWASERRDLTADFLRAFGEESREVPPLLAVAVGADADNTGGHSLAYVADLVLSP